MAALGCAPGRVCGNRAFDRAQLGRPLRQGPVYVSRALDPSGQEVRVIINAQMGRVVRVVPVTMPRYGVPVVRPPGRIVMAPDGRPRPARARADGMQLGGPLQGANRGRAAGRSATARDRGRSSPADQPATDRHGRSADHRRRPRG